MLTSSAEFQIEVIKDQSLLSEGQKSNFDSFLIENASQDLYLCLNIPKTADSFCHIVSHQDEALTLGTSTEFALYSIESHRYVIR